MRKELSWKPVRRGKVYCAPACGRGCTWDEYHAARDAGIALARRLGPNWESVVHENLGWHYRAKHKSVDIVVHENNKRRYWCDMNADGRQIEAHANSPRAAIDAVLAQAVALMRLYTRAVTLLELDL